MSNLLLKRDELQILGKLLRKERESGCYTGQEIAQKIGLSKQIILDIETGSKNVSFEKVKLYADFFDINLKKYDVNIFKKIFRENIHYLVYADYDSFNIKTMSIIQNEENYISTCDAPLYYLLQMTYSILHKDHEKVKRTVEIIEEYFIDLFGLEELFIYYVYLGNYYANKNILEKAMSYYDEAKNKCTDICVDLKGILYYGMGFVYWQLGNPINSLIAHEKAKEFFDISHNYIRSLYTSCHIGRNLMQLYRYEDVEEMYEHLIKSASLLNNKRALNSIQLNRAENYFYKGDYESAIEVAQECLNEGLYPVQMNDIQMWSYYKLGKLNECNCALQRLKESYNGLDEYYRLMIGTMQAILDNDSNRVVKYLKLLFTFTETDSFYIVQDFILDLLIENLSKQKRYREAMDYSRIQMNLLRRKMSEPRKN